MKIIIEQIPKEQEQQVVIRCHDPRASWVTQIREVFAPSDVLVGIKDGASCKVRLRDVYYFEVVDGRSFIYMEKEVYESKLKLYEFEEFAEKAGFFKASRSMMVSANRVTEVKPSLSGRFMAVLTNGEKVIISRQYVSELKRVMGL